MSDDNEETQGDRFDRVTEHVDADYRARPSGLARLQAILAVLLDAGVTGDFCAEHDEVFLAGEDDTAKLSDEQLIKLAELGVHHDDESGSLAVFC